MKVLIIVDLQNDFCPRGSLAVTDGDKIVPIINELINSGEFDLIIATKDWHPANHISFSQWPIHTVQGTLGAELHPDLDQSKIDKIILKGLDPDVDSYSAFYDNERISQTELKAYLDKFCQQKGIDPKELEVFCVGLAGDICVKFTAIDAASIGYHTSFITDATKNVYTSKELEAQTLVDLRQAGVKLVTSVEVLQSVDRIPPIPLVESLEEGRGMNHRCSEIEAGVAR